MRTILLCLIAISLGLAGLTLSTAAADDAGSAAVTAPLVDTTAATPPAPPLGSQLTELQAQYKALKANKDASAKMLLWAALLATGLKLLLSGVNLVAGKKPAKWLAWIALGLAVPIALLSYYAGGNSLFESLVYAGSGPGAIVVHELLKAFAKKPAEAAT